ncbi:SDR family oxidoreductase [Streptomyces sp. VNUA24]|uniref:SDR family oxidoreductase n=1 Tax=Streptomyces sp. VNUA24 TaxID=3031131 RepID=UPI0023B85066|nr:SDR family oxidoreductase [Streptomyces sp. VNUA24]WEH12971.1 SDR family oxidoreductase [Streptomyces sp. VNUA24]
MTERKAAIVTGSSRGIGRAIAVRLAADGIDVIVNCRSRREAADKVVAEIEAAGGRAVAVQADVAVPEQIRALFAAAEQHFGGVDILVHNAGSPRFTTIADATDEDFEIAFVRSARAAFVALREAANQLRDGGRIVVISSGSSVDHIPNGGIYGAGKAATDRMVRTVAQELGPRRITANSVLPGATRTDGLLEHLPAGAVDRLAALSPLGRIAEPEDIADVVAFLTSDAGRWVTGQAIRAHGGAS